MNPTATTVLTDKSSTRVMGILNITPDSFFDGGRYFSPEAAAAHAQKMVDDGAHILDVGAESSRPGAAPVTAEEEVRRALPAIEAAVATGCPVSIDTWRAGTAQRALEHGAIMVNDITGLRGDADMAATIANAGCFCVIMHMQGTPQTMQHNPEYADVIADITTFFEERIEYALGKGIPQDRIWLDPGFGFGKTVQQNLEILRRIEEFRKLGFPLLIGTSNKSTIGAILDASPENRDYGTAATVAIAINKGVHCIRVHNVKAMTQVARMCNAVLKQQD